MTESAHALLESMRSYIDRLPDDEERVLPSDYAEKVKALGEVPFLVTACRELADSEFSSWMLRLSFCWKDLTFQEWRSVFQQISEDRIAVYPFVWFATEALALDVSALVRSDPDLTEMARAIFANAFPNGARPIADSPWWQEMLEERGVDRTSIIRRLAIEGAPVKLP